MRQVFVDTSYWIALVNTKDKLHQRVKTVLPSLTSVHFVTTDEVLVEFLTYFSSYGPEKRYRVGKRVQDIMNSSNIEVLPQSRDSFLSGLELYLNRLDKDYSLTDCISMETMKRLGLTEILSHDKHFSQEGYQILL